MKRISFLLLTLFLILPVLFLLISNDAFTATCSNEGGGCSTIPCCPGLGLTCQGSPGHEICVKTIETCASYEEGCYNQNQWCWQSECINCSSGFANCDFVEGCEVNLNTDKNNCGFCNNVCTSGQVCQGGNCTAPGGETTPPPNGSGLTTIQNPLHATSVEALVSAVAGFIFKIGLALAPVMLIIAGLMFVTSGGSPERVQTAKKLALYTIIGLAIILLASGLITMLKSILGTTS